MGKLFRALVSAWLRNEPGQIPPDLDRKDLLDIGPGRHIRDEFITVDFNWRGGLDICWDIQRGLPLSDACVSGVFTEHCLEHVPLESGDRVLGEIYRVLKPGGRVRIVVPDAAIYLRRYVALVDGEESEALPYADRDAFEDVYEPILSVNRIFYEHEHRFIYDFRMLSRLLARKGFGDITRTSFMKGVDERLLIDTAKRQLESLYVEAVKPAV